MDPPRTQVYFVSVKHGKRAHKLIKFVSGTCVSDVRLKAIIPLGIRGSPPVLDDAGVSLDGMDKLPDCVRVLLDVETYQLLESDGNFFEYS